MWHPGPPAEAQLNAGAWGITVVTAGQALACRAFGVPRVLLANELLDPGALAWIAGQLDQGWERLLFVDSAAGVWAASGLAPGDLICFGISHPCTAFDKWPVIPVIDGDTVTDLIRTYF
jgi:D-serine deaminase-like pyridoxal phosphate-dependent protein